MGQNQDYSIILSSVTSLLTVNRKLARKVYENVRLNAIIYNKLAFTDIHNYGLSLTNSIQQTSKRVCRKMLTTYRIVACV